MIEKTDVCWLCAHMYFYNGSPGYSEYTPGYDMEMGCGKGHWRLDPHDDSQKDFRRKITMSQTCKDFKNDV